MYFGEPFKYTEWANSVSLSSVVLLCECVQTFIITQPLLTCYHIWCHCNFSLRDDNINHLGQAPEVLTSAADDGKWTVAEVGDTD